MTKCLSGEGFSTEEKGRDKGSPPDEMTKKTFQWNNRPGVSPYIPEQQKVETPRR